MITGANDWNYNDGCAVNATRDGGKTWTPTLPNGFLPGITKFTNDPNVAGTGAYDAGGDPTIAFSPNGKIAYYVCQSFDFSSPFSIAMLMNRSTDGGFTWQSTGLTQVSTFTGNGISRGGNGQFPDHESLYVDPATGYVYVTWAQFNGKSAHSPVLVNVSHDQGKTWTLNQVTDRQRAQQPGPAHRHRSVRQRLSRLRQRRAGRQGHRAVRGEVDRRRHHLGRSGAVRVADQSRLRLPAELLQHRGRAVPRRRARTRRRRSTARGTGSTS